MTIMMRTFVMRRIGEVGFLDKPQPEDPAPNGAIVKTTCALICTSDTHTVDGAIGERTNLTLGHEAVGVVAKLDREVKRVREGDRVAVNAVTPCFRCESCLRGFTSQCEQMLGGWKFANVRDGVFAPYFFVNDAEACDSQCSHRRALGLDDRLVAGDVDWFAPRGGDEPMVFDAHVEASEQHAACRHLVDDGIEPRDEQKLVVGRIAAKRYSEPRHHRIHVGHPLRASPRVRESRRQRHARNAPTYGYDCSKNRTASSAQPVRVPIASELIVLGPKRRPRPARRSVRVLHGTRSAVRGHGRMSRVRSLRSSLVDDVARAGPYLAVTYMDWRSRRCIAMNSHACRVASPTG